MSTCDPMQFKFSSRRRSWEWSQGSYLGFLIYLSFKFEVFMPSNLVQNLCVALWLLLTVHSESCWKRKRRFGFLSLLKEKGKGSSCIFVLNLNRLWLNSNLIKLNLMSIKLFDFINIWILLDVKSCFNVIIS